MTVKQLIRSLEKVKDKRLPVRVLDKPAKFEAEVALVERVEPKCAACEYGPAYETSRSNGRAIRHASDLRRLTKREAGR